MDAKLQYAIEQLEQVRDDLMKIPGVTAVDVGNKYVNGVPTGEICIRIHVQKKHDPANESERIPTEINGVKTDVIEGTYELF